jgi:hypothetical protein
MIRSRFCQLFAIVLWFLGSGVVDAQDRTESQVSNNWEIGMDMIGLFRKQVLVSTPYSANTIPTVLVRRNYITQNGSGRGIRFRAGIDFTNNDNISAKREIDVSLLAGYEFQKKISNKMNVNYGVDAAYDLRNIENQQFLGVAGIPSINLIRFPSKAHRVGLNGFIGVRYFITPSLSISTECTASVFKRFYDVNNYVSNADVLLVVARSTSISNQPLIYLRAQSERATNVKITPLTYINLSFHL